jgi:Ca2+-binding RTX toxin-like protein
MRENGKLTRTCVAVIAAVGMAGAMPAAAGAATVGVTGTTLTFQDGPAGNYVPINFIDDSPPATNLRFASSTGPLLVGTGCTAGTPAGQAAFCATTGFARIVVLMGAGNDTVVMEGTGLPLLHTVRLPTRINGGPGNDDLRAGNGDDVVTGGLGTNTVRGFGGNDRLLMRNGTRDTLIDCGEGTDTAVIDSNDPRPIACETVLKPG